MEGDTTDDLVDLVFDISDCVIGEYDSQSSMRQDLETFMQKHFVDQSEGAPAAKTDKLTLDYFKARNIEMDFPNKNSVIIKLRRLQLCESIHYFKAMLDSGMMESKKKGSIDMKQFDLLEFLHLGRHIWVDHANVSYCRICMVNSCEYLFSLLSSAVYFQCSELIEEIISHMTIHLSLVTCLQSMCAAYQYSVPKLYSKAKRYALYHCASLCTEIVTLSKSIEHQSCIMEYLHHPMLHLTDSAKIFLLNEELIQMNGKQTNQQALPVQDFTVEVCEKIPSKHYHCVELRDSTDQVVHSQELILNESEKKECCKLHGAAIAYSGKDLYLSGGEFGLGKGKWNNRIYHLDTITRVWKVLGTMPQPIRHYAMCCSVKALYILGGFNKYRIKLTSAYRYCIQTDKISKLPDLPQNFHAKSAVIDSNDSILVVHSGSLDDTYFMDIKHMDGSDGLELSSHGTSGWRPKSELSMKSPRGEWDDIFSELIDELSKERGNNVQLIWYPEFALSGGAASLN